MSQVESLLRRAWIWLGRCNAREDGRAEVNMQAWERPDCKAATAHPCLDIGKSVNDACMGNVLPISRYPQIVYTDDGGLADLSA